MLTKIADIPQQMLDLYSRLLIMDAMPMLYFRQFVDYKLDFSVQPGERMMFTNLDNLVKGGKLVDEDTPITKNKMTGSSVYVSMYEWGNAAAFSRRASVASLRNMMEDCKKVLARDYALVMDEYLRDTFQTTANKIYMANNYVAGAVVGSVDAYLDHNALGTIVQKAKELNMPKLQRGADSFYAFVGNPNAIRQIRYSSRWLDARRYVNPSEMLNGEAGRLDDVVFFDTTQMQTTAGIGSNSVLCNRSMFIGAGCVALGESVPMELIPEVPEDFGRKQSIAWYTIAGAGILNDFAIEVYTKNGMFTTA